MIHTDQNHWYSDTLHGLVLISDLLLCALLQVSQLLLSAAESRLDHREDPAHIIYTLLSKLWPHDTADPWPLTRQLAAEGGQLCGQTLKRKWKKECLEWVKVTISKLFCLFICMFFSFSQVMKPFFNLMQPVIGLLLQ